MQPYGGAAAGYGFNNGIGNSLDDRRFNAYSNGSSLAGSGSMALYHRHGTRYGLGIGGQRWCLPSFWLLITILDTAHDATDGSFQVNMDNIEINIV